MKRPKSKIKPTLKAWTVWVGEWCDHCHAPTAAKAKAIFWKQWSYEAGDYTALRALRYPEYDDEPFSDSDEDGWTQCCKCELCDV